MTTIMATASGKGRRWLILVANSGAAGAQY
jgi:hypothetical protein